MARREGTRYDKGKQEAERLAEQSAERITDAERARRERKRKQKEELASYRGIPKALQVELKGIADELHVPLGQVARLFLEYGRDAYRRGDLTPEARAKVDAVSFTLYP